jgi:hypothetical protein
MPKNVVTLYAEVLGVCIAAVSVLISSIKAGLRLEINTM